jgi:chromate transporter
LFLRLGLTAFGGPAAHIAMMEEEVVRRRGWLTHDEFLDMLGATNLIPGPNSTEMAIHIGHRRAGWPGLVAAGVCFIVPAASITLLLAWAYVRFGAIPRASALLYGIKPVMIAVVVQALFRLGKSAVKSKVLGALGAMGAAAAFVGVDELAILFASGLVSVVVVRPWRDAGSSAFVLAAPTSMFGAASASSIFLVFAKIGSVLFGSGYVLLAFMRTDLVERRHWLTEAQLLDAIAIGQLTPGPVFTTATFVGYLLERWAGAAAATAGIFLPAFVFVALSGLVVPKLRASTKAGPFLDGVNIASLALMAVVTIHLGRASVVDVPTALIALVSAALLIAWRVSSVYLILGGGLAGLLAWSLR